MHSVPITIPGAPHNFTLTYIHSQLSSFAYSTNRSTIDHLVRFDTYIRKALAEGYRIVAVFFDIEKASDMAWRYGVMKDLTGAGLSGDMSSTKYQLTGGPQSSTLSVTLLDVKINSLAKVIPTYVFSS